MNTGIFELLALGVAAIFAAAFLVVSMVRELAPDERRKWLLGIGLGTGVIAFSLKIGLIVVFSRIPGPILDLFPAQQYTHATAAEPADPGHNSDTSIVSYTWRALPHTAPYPQDNPPSPETIALGKKLFFDTRLSADGSLSCASCHEISPEKGGGDGLRTSIGINGLQGSRNAPTVLNAAFQQLLFWDGRAASLEEQVKGPLLNPIEMGMPSLDRVVEKVRNIPGYQKEFLLVFSTRPPVTIENIAKAIATYERTLITPDSPYDRFVKGDFNALSDKQLRGMALFESTGCVQCHSGPNFSGASIFRDNAPYRVFPAIPNTEFEAQYQLNDDLGAARATDNSDRGIWRIPSLRNISRTAPYFHNGSVKSLAEAVRIMAHVQLGKTLSNKQMDDQSIHWSEADRRLSISTHLALSDTEIEEIVAFLAALNGELPK